MAKANPLLSVIVLSFNTKDITDECLTRLKKAVSYLDKSQQKSAEAIVVENASEDGSLEMIQKKHPWVELIVSKTNTGFSGGNNLAMAKAKGEFILLLNSDAYVEEDTLIKSVEYFNTHPECDILGCRLKFADGRFQPSAGFLPTPLNTIFWISGLNILSLIEQLSSPIHPRDKSFFSKDRQVEWVMGAYFMMKRRAYEETGGFDETIFMYGEEVEWCQRIKDKGFKVFYTQEFAITHLDKASSKFMLQKPLLNEIKGIVRFFKQHYPKDYGYVRVCIFLSLLLRVLGFTLFWNPPRRRAYAEALKVI